VAVAIQMQAPAISYEVPLLAQEITSPATLLQPMEAQALETTRLGFTPVLPGQAAVLMTAPGEKVTSTQGQLTSLTPEAASAMAGMLKNDPLLGAISATVQATRQEVSQAKSQAITPSLQFTLMDLTATSLASAKAARAAQIQAPVQETGQMGVLDTGLVPAEVLAPVTVVMPMPVIIPFATEVPPPVTPTPQIPRFPEFPGFGGGGGGWGLRRRPRTWGTLAPWGIDVSTFGAIEPDVRAAIRASGRRPMALEPRPSPAPKQKKRRGKK
jgi:hypothetical protein